MSSISQTNLIFHNNRDPNVNLLQLVSPLDLTSLFPVVGRSVLVHVSDFLWLVETCGTILLRSGSNDAHANVACTSHTLAASRIKIFVLTCSWTGYVVLYMHTSTKSSIRWHGKKQGIFEVEMQFRMPYHTL